MHTIPRPLLAAAAALALAGTAAAATPKPPNPWRTDAQAGRYLDRLTHEQGWYCLNGYYSRREQRLRRHVAGYMRYNGATPPRFRSFTCTLGGSGRPDLYLQTRPAGTRWVVVVDR